MEQDNGYPDKEIGFEGDTDDLPRERGPKAPAAVVEDVDPDEEAAESLSDVLSDLQVLNADRSTSTRGRALAITKIEEALFWLNKKD